RLASALVASGTPLTDVASLAVLVQPDNAKAALRYLLDRRGGKTGSDLSSLARLLQTIARHWVRDSAVADDGGGVQPRAVGEGPGRASALRRARPLAGGRRALCVPPRHGQRGRGGGEGARAGRGQGQ